MENLRHSLSLYVPKETQNIIWLEADLTMKIICWKLGPEINYWTGHKSWRHILLGGIPMVSQIHWGIQVPCQVLLLSSWIPCRQAAATLPYNINGEYLKNMFSMDASLLSWVPPVLANLSFRISTESLADTFLDKSDLYPNWRIIGKIHINFLCILFWVVLDF